MPSLRIALVIVGFWIASISTLAWQEFAPWLETDQPPPFTIDLVAEATGQEPTVFWNIYRLEPKQEPKAIGRARTTLMKYEPDLDIFRPLGELIPPDAPDPPDSETFILHGELIDFEVYANPVLRLMVKKMDTLLRVDRKGALLWLGTKTLLSGEVGPSISRVTALRPTIVLQGDVVDGELRPDVLIHTDFTDKYEIEGEPVPIPSTSVLNPMHPVNRITGVRPGMRWRMPAVDPLGSALRASFQSAAQKVMPEIPVPEGPQFFDAEVLKETEPVTVKAGTFPCWIIEYRSKSMKARTYVKVGDGLVLRQEAMSLRDGEILDHFRLQRE